MLKKGRRYYVAGYGPCECILVTSGRARLKPYSTKWVTIPGDPSIGRKKRQFLARGKAFNVSPTAPFVEIDDKEY
jgi:hypothetical protein